MVFMTRKIVLGETFLLLLSIINHSKIWPVEVGAEVIRLEVEELVLVDGVVDGCQGLLMSRNKWTWSLGALEGGLTLMLERDLWHLMVQC